MAREIAKGGLWRGREGDANIVGAGRVCKENLGNPPSPRPHQTIQRVGRGRVYHERGGAISNAHRFPFFYSLRRITVPLLPGPFGPILPIAKARRTGACSKLERRVA